MRKATRFILIKICDLLSVCNSITPKSNKNILFFTNIPGFNDNNRALFEYMIDNGYQRNYKIFLSIPDYKKRQTNNNADKNVCYISPLLGMFLFMFSKYCFYDSGTVKIKPSKDQVVISLWHGTPLKKIGRSVENSAKNDRYNDFTRIVCTSDNLLKIFAESFECSEENVIVTGYPRNDNLFNTNDYLHLQGLDTNEYLKKVLWMPTYRVSADNRYVNVDDSFNSETGIQLFPTVNDLVALDEVLRVKSVLLCIKLHPLSFANKLVFPSFTNISIVNNNKLEQMDIQNYKFVSNFDSLLTDYSSVYFDFLLLDRPIGFVIDDIKMYESCRGFSFENPLELMPGAKIYDLPTFHDFIDSLVAGKDLFKDDRKKVNQMMNKYRDANSSLRVLNYSGIMIPRKN